jgi:phage terminase large subunit
MKYSPKQEEELMSDIWTGNIKDNPLNFVRYVFPWGQEGTPLEEFTGPRKWQEKILVDLTNHIQKNAGKLDPNMFRLAVASGRGIGKSALVAWIILWMLSTRLGSTVIVTANTEQQLRSRTWAELGKWLTLAINGHWFHKTATTLKPVDWFEASLKKDLQIDTGYYYGQAQLWSEENPDAFAGVHSNYGVCLIMDEASGIPAPIYSVAEGFFSEPTENRFWFTFSNPRRNTGPFYDSFHSSKAFWNTEQIDSRNVEGTDTKVFQQMIEQYGEDSTVSRVEVMGEFPQSDDDTVIPLDLVRAAIDRDVALTTEQAIVWGLDVARFGGDNSALCKRQGNTVLDIKTFKSMDLMQLCGAVKAEYDTSTFENKPQEILVDVIGLGSGVVDRLAEQNLPVRGVNVAEAPSTKKNYLNLRAELWFAIKDWLAQRDCRLPNNDELASELAAPQYKYTSSGKIKIESKDEMRKRGIKSPDRADALALTMASSAASFSGSQSYMGYNFKKPLKSRIFRVG